MHLQYDMMTAALQDGVGGHPQKVMQELGITYQNATPQSIADSWLFWNCANVPEMLPSYLVSVDVDPMGCVGYGLSEDMARSIKAVEKTQL